MRNIFFYVICALIAAVPAFAAKKAEEKIKSASDDVIAQARLAAAAEESGQSAVAEEASQSLTVSEATDEATTEASVVANASTAEKALTQDEIKNMKESEIPLIGADKQLKKGESSPWLRLLSTVAVVGALLGAALFGIKRYGRKSNSKTQSTKIRVVTNHHIGPKKSLMIVNVAGESLLLGVTDHNISILKNLSLLDEELPADVPKTFAGAINESFVDNAAPATPADRFEEDSVDDFAVQGLAAIKDKVSTRLKNMRQI